MFSIGGGESEVAQIRAVINSSRATTSCPLLVLSCVSREEQETMDYRSHEINTNLNRTPCVHMAKRLGLPQLANPWMVKNYYLLKSTGFIHIHYKL